MIRPGEIYMADFAEAGPHPVIVLSREELNRGRYALVVVCTSARFAVRSQLPNCVPFRLAQLDLSAGPRATIDAMAFREVIRAIG